MRSTPVRAIDPIVSKRTPPEASRSIEGRKRLRSSTACFNESIEKLSRSAIVRVSSGNKSSASNCSIVSASAHTNRRGVFLARRSSTALRMRRAYSLGERPAIWLSFTRSASARLHRCKCPPPQRTAYFCNHRKPGMVLRVSHTFAFVPATASTYFAVIVEVAIAIPSRLSKTRSIGKMLVSGASRRSNDAPATTLSPSIDPATECAFNALSRVTNSSTSPNPAQTASARATT